MATRKAINTELTIATLGHELTDQDAIFAYVNKAIGGHGVESIWQGNDKPSCRYINMGDTYANTLIYDENTSKWLVMSWGDWLEEQELEGHVYN